MINYLRFYKTPIFILLLGSIISISLSIAIKKSNDKSVANFFENHSNEIISAINRNVFQYQYGLRGARGVFLVNETLDLKQFESYSNSRDYTEEFPGSLGFGHIIKIRNREIEGLNKKMAQEGIKDFKTYYLSQHSYNPDYKYIIRYIEPRKKNQKALGLDISSEKNRFEAAERAMRNNEVAMTAPITLVQDNEKKAGALLFLPHYKANHDISNEENRIKNLIGWTYTPVIFENGFNKILDKYSNKLKVEIYHENGDLIYSNHSSKNFQEKIRRNQDIFLTVSSSTILFGTRWNYKITTLPGFKNIIPHTDPTLYFVFFMAINIIIFLILASNTFVKFKAQSLADQMTKMYKEKKEEAENANKEKSEFLATVGHEIKTPLSGLIGLFDLLIEHENSIDQIRLLENAKESGLGLMHLLNDLLDFSKLSAGKMQIENVHFNFKNLIDQTIELFQKEITKKNLSLKLTIDSRIENNLLGDSFRIKQILVNLLSNAVKFTSEGSIEIDLELIEENNQEQKIRFSIKDTGIGITKEKEQKLFTQYLQAENSISRKFGGTGLGLSICKYLIELMNGEIGLSSQFGIGTKIFFIIPLKIYNANQIGLRLDLNQNTNILLVEDNLINQKIAKALLEKFNFSIEIVSNGKEAITACKSKHYHIILLDLELPDYSGLEVCQVIRKNQTNKNLIIGLSAHSEIEIKQKCLEAGMDDFFSKPISKQNIQFILAKYFNV